MLTQYNKAAAGVGSASATQEKRGWTNVPAQRQDKVAAVISDPKDQGSSNVPPGPATTDR
jgi:hypothetical protein